MNYVAVGAPNPLNTQGIPWCRICQTRGNNYEEFMYLHMIVRQHLLCIVNFVDQYVMIKDCRSFKLLQEKTMDTYLLKNDEKMKAERAQP